MLPVSKIKQQLSQSALWTVLILSFFFRVQVACGQKAKKWKAPASENDLKNPFKDDAGSILEGKKLFMAMCSVCHGETGKGAACRFKYTSVLISMKYACRAVERQFVCLTVSSSGKWGESYPYTLGALSFETHFLIVTIAN